MPLLGPYLTASRSATPFTPVALPADTPAHSLEVYDDVDLQVATLLFAAQWMTFADQTLSVDPGEMDTLVLPIFVSSWIPSGANIVVTLRAPETVSTAGTRVDILHLTCCSVLTLRSAAGVQPITA